MLRNFLCIIKNITANGEIIMRIIRNRELIIVGKYELRYVPVKNNKVPQIIITVPANYNKENMDRYIYALLCRIIKDNPEHNDEFYTYEISLDQSYS